MSRVLWAGVGLLVGVCLLPGLIALWLIGGFGTVPYEELLRKYRLPNSQFVELVGSKVHVVDEGTGPPILLIHGSYESLREWEIVAQELKGRYRVIRYDRTASGLTITDPQGRIDTEDEVRRIELLLDHLKLPRVAIAAVSSGASHAIYFAAAHPDRVSALILSSSPGGVVAGTAFRAPYGLLEKWVYRHYRPINMHLGEVHSVIAQHNWLVPAVQEEYRDFVNRREPTHVFLGAPEVPAEQFDAYLGRITAPTLLIWGRENPAYPAASIPLITRKLTKARVESLIYEGVGHKVTREAPQRMAADILSFLGRVSEGAAVAD
jgi:pimeloyl-ACP methyl ester carboxylesterase